MKIVVVSSGCPSTRHPDWGLFAFDQARALVRVDHTVILAALNLHSIRYWRKWGLRSFEKEGVLVEEINIPCGRIPEFLFNFIGRHAFACLYKRIEKKYGKPDIVHAHFSTIASLCVKYANSCGVKTVVTEHSSAVNQDKLTPRTMRTIRSAYAKADCTIAVSSALVKQIQKHSGIKAIVIPNVLDTAAFSSNLPDVRLRKDIFRFVTACNLVPLKRVSRLLKAFAALSKKNCTLTIFGDGSLRNRLEQEANELGISGQVYFRGHCSETLRENYIQSDCFVLPSSTETFGVAYIEAMSCGLPVIATRCGGPEDFVTEQNGELIAVDHEEELIAAMEYVYENINAFDKKKIKEYVNLNFSEKTIARRLTECYQFLICEEQK